MAQGDRLLERLWNLHVFQVTVEVGVDVELPFLDLLHHRGPGKQLRDGADPEHRRFGVNPLSPLDVGVAITFREDELVPDDDGNDRPRDVVGFHLHGKDAVKKRFEVGRVRDFPGVRSR